MRRVGQNQHASQDREYMILAPTVEGTMLLITRYIYPQAPPRSPFPPKAEMNSIEECVRFVSLIPFLEYLTSLKIRPPIPNCHSIQK